MIAMRAPTLIAIGKPVTVVSAWLMTELAVEPEHRADRAPCPEQHGALEAAARATAVRE